MEKPVETLLLACAPILAGLLFLFGALYFWRGGRELRERGATAQATVAKKFRIRSRAWHMLREGGAEEITYLPGRPETAELGPRWAKRLLGGVFLFFAAAGGLMAFTGLALLAGWLRT